MRPLSSEVPVESTPAWRHVRALRLREGL